MLLFDYSLQTFMTERVSDVQRRGSAEVEKVLMEYLTKNGAFMCLKNHPP